MTGTGIWSKSKTEANKMVYDEMRKYVGKIMCSLWKGVWCEAGE